MASTFLTVGQGEMQPSKLCLGLLLAAPGEYVLNETGMISLTLVLEQLYLVQTILQLTSPLQHPPVLFS